MLALGFVAAGVVFLLAALLMLQCIKSPRCAGRGKRGNA